MTETVSAIVVSYFTGPLLERAIASLRAQPEVAEIILVNNGNWPNAVSEAIEASAGAPVRVLSGQGNIGFSRACNLGATAAAGRYLLFLNPDAELPAGAATRLITDGKDRQQPWMMGPLLIGPDGREQKGSRRLTLTPWRALVEILRLDRLAPDHPYFRRFNLHESPLPQQIAAAPVISGACFFMPRRDYFLIGGMDERYFLHVEDIDFCVRFAAAGGVVLFNPHVRVRHARSSSRVDAMRVERRKTASTIRYFRTHFSRSYPPGFLSLVEGVLWILFAGKVGKRGVERFLKLFGHGPLVVSRARRLERRRRSR